ncbi:MAG: universal stress protein [Euryarchaeota archaeon]|nr:universal stress protein [Euryarchaeota archaeon]
MMWTRLLLATDGSPAARRAEDLAFRMARSFSVQVFALTVVRELTEEDRGDEVASAMEMLNVIIARGRAEGVAVEGRLERGDPARRIVEMVSELGIDAVIVGTEGRRGVAHVVLGSVAERIVRESPKTVIVAK